MKSDQSSLNDHSKNYSRLQSCRSRFAKVKRWHACAALLAAAVAVLNPTVGRALSGSGEPESCRTIRFSDVGWTDVTATTALVAQLVRSIGYTPTITVLSVPVTFASIQNKDIDVFLGNWMPAQEADRKKYVDDGSVVVVRANLEGAKYTLAVPAYAYDAGLKDFKDIQHFAGPLNNSIYGIEPGNDGNRLVLKMLKQDEFGLADFKLVESSEQGELAQVERAYHNRQPIVFLAWEPHPMNMRFDLKYLEGGDEVFGPNYGGATIYTVTRRGYSTECPNVGRLLTNLKFTLRGESEVMAGLLDRHEQPDIAAAEWLKANPTVAKAWLDGVLTYDGKPAYAALARSVPPPRPGGFEQWVVSHKIPVGDAMAAVIDAVKTHGTLVFDGISIAIRGMVSGVTAMLRLLPAPALIVGVAVLAYGLRRSWPLTVFVALALLFILNQGYWVATIETLSLVLVATLTSAAIGVPVGIAAAHHPRLFAALRPALDLMQTLPTFVYLIPTLVLFGLGVVPGLISTVIFALPAPIRLTHLGISSVPRPLIEAGQSFGATPLQLLWKIELPSASTTIIAGITQCIMLSLSMVVIAALVGAGGLGVPVVRALNSVQVGMGFEAGFTIVLLAIILDRISRPTRTRSFAMNAAVEFQDVDILFARQPGREGRKAIREAVAALDAGGTRSDIQTQYGVIVGVAGANLSVARGEISVLMGLSGSGKSTLLRAANGLNPVTRGRVLVHTGAATIDVANCNTAEMREVRRGRVAMVFQQFGLLPWRTVRENVGFGLELRGDSTLKRKSVVDEKLELVGLSQWAERYVSELSGGMQQRVGLARAFATDADILLMDEPFSALDPLIRGKLQDELLALQERVKKTILFVSHDLDEALRLGDRISILQNGRIIQTGTAEDIVLAPADDYVAEFVRHMNPLDVLTGSMIMCERANLAPDGDALWLDERRRYRLSIGTDGQATGLHFDGVDHALHHVQQDQAPSELKPGVAVAPASFSLQSLIQLRQATGHPVLLAEGLKIVGVCGEIEIIRALANSRH